tara:strand:+ start:2012 stop:2260 length:249 start_codon:yes stop_codon:yes gene_type:complete
MAMSDKELKKIKAMMPSGATLAGLKNIIKGQLERAKIKKNKADRNPPKSKKSKKPRMAQQQQAAMQQLYGTKRQRVNKAKLR